MGSSSSFVTELPGIKKLNDGLYEFYIPPDGTYTIEIIFFHGLSLGRRKDCRRAFVDTWMSSDEGTDFCWPQKLLAAEFPFSRILSVSYDSAAHKGSTTGRADAYIVTENLVHDLILNNKGHRSGCPMILVGKDIGGLVIKTICLRVSHQRSEDKRYESFLSDIRGILYYSTPHRGFRGLPKVFNGAMIQQLGFEHENEVVRVSWEFSKLRMDTFRWRTKGIGNNGTESELNIPEASARVDCDDYYTATHDNLHSIGRPRKQNQISYSFLSDLIHESIKKSSSSDPSSSDPSSSSPSSSSTLPVNTSSLLFTFDKSYVPMEDTRQEVDEAFENSSIVVLYGDSGTGKSSFARHYVLRYEEIRKMMDPGQSHSSPIACFVYCGREAVVDDIQKQLLQAFGIKESQTQELPRRTTLVNSLRDHDALVILDDVWESDFLEQLLVPGKSFKYLITTRKANLWPADDAWRVQIQAVSEDAAHQILANYAKFESGRIPEQFKVQAGQLIDDVRAHPLALATVGAVLQRGNKFIADEWKSLRRNLLKYLNRKEYKSINCGKSYPITVSAALMLMLDEKVLEPDAMQLLYIINLFQGPLISESMFKFFLKYFQPTALADFDINIRELEDLSLVERVFIPVYLDVRAVLLYAPADILEKTCSFEADPQKHLTIRIRIHDLRRRFILQQKKGEMDALKALLLEQKESCHDWATALCAILGENSVKEEAQKKLGLLDLGSSDPDAASTHGKLLNGVPLGVPYKLEDALDHLPDVCFEADTFDNGPSNNLANECTQVLWNLFIARKIDGHTISTLLTEKNSKEWMCRALLSCFSCGRISTRQLTDADKDIRCCTDTLIALLSEDLTVTTRLLVLGILHDMTLHLCQDEVPSDLLQRVMDTQKLVHTLAKGAFLRKDEPLCAHAVKMIRRVACSQAAVILHSPSCQASLVCLVADDVHVDVQEVALAALVRTVDRDANDYEEPFILDVFVLLTVSLVERLVPLLSKDLGARCQLSTCLLERLARTPICAVIIANSSCLEKIIQLLDEDVAADLRVAALIALETIVSGDKATLETPVDEDAIIFDALATVTSDLLLKIVPLLCKNQGEECGQTFASLSLSMIGSLSRGPSCAIIILNCHSFLRKVLELLAEDVPADLQEHALLTLVSIFWGIYSHPDLLSFDLLTGVASDLVLAIVPFFSRNRERPLRVVAEFLMVHLVTDPTCAMIIATTNSCQYKLKELLVNDVIANFEIYDLEEAIRYIVGFSTLL